MDHALPAGAVALDAAGDVHLAYTFIPAGDRGDFKVAHWKAGFDGVLADRRFLAGDRFIIADITALCGLDFGKISNLRIKPEHAHLSRWHAEVSSRPSAKA